MPRREALLVVPMLQRRCFRYVCRELGYLPTTLHQTLYMMKTLRLFIILLTTLASRTMQAEEEFVSIDQLSAASSNPVLWQQYQALQVGAPLGESQSCGGDSYDRCGCSANHFPWFDGPGICDPWCVGPKWAVAADGLLLFRDDADLALITGAAGDVFSFDEQFDHGPGARLFVTAYNDSGFGIQVGYEGVNDWNATREFTNGTTIHTFDYDASVNSIEINFLPQAPYAWKFFGGVRYLELSEGFIDSTIAAKPLPAPANPPAAPTVVSDTVVSNLLKNRLIGFQLGGLRDHWQFSRWFSIEAFGNAGVYCNKFQRDDVTLNIATTLFGDDTSTPAVNETAQVVSTSQSVARTDVTQIAYVGEAGITGVVRLNPCVALRGGYQILALDGVGEALQASLTPGINSSTLVFHGLQFGLEYRR
ncbi:MAG: hypothetical protein MI725_01950 [Pirellulales bacterium]|nr:hypothetical protein [Pirellulales bacterium]